MEQQYEQVHVNPLRVFNRNYNKFKTGDIISTELKFNMENMTPFLHCQPIEGEPFDLNMSIPEENKMAADFLTVTDIVNNQH